MSTADTIRDQTIAQIEESARTAKTVQAEEAPGYLDIQTAIFRIRCTHHTRIGAGLEFLGHTSEGKPWRVLLSFSKNRRARK